MKTHPKVDKIEPLKVNKAVALKRGRPSKPNKYPLDNKKTIYLIKSRGLVLYGMKFNKLVPHPDSKATVNFIKLCIRKYKQGKVKDLSIEL